MYDLTLAGTQSTDWSQSRRHYRQNCGMRWSTGLQEGSEVRLAQLENGPTGIYTFMRNRDRAVFPACDTRCCASSLLRGKKECCNK